MFETVGGLGGETRAMHRLVEGALPELDLTGQLPTLARCSDFTQQTIRTAREYLSERLPPAGKPIDIVALGSFARDEASTESDFDYLVVAHGLVEPATTTRDILRALDDLIEDLHLKRPGVLGLFGRVVAAPDLTERIGLDQDTNLTHTRRILVLEESCSIYQPDLRNDLIRNILSRYLVDYDLPKAGIPRFLLNDVMRYWRTLAVDYQAKRWEELELNWGLRYLKLIISRKLAYAATLVSLLLCQSATVEYLTEQFAMPPLARLAQTATRLEVNPKAALKRAFQIAEEFALALEDPAFREQAKAVRSRADIAPGSRFAQMINTGRELQTALESVFYESALLSQRSHRYLSF